jgi:hypothetical protein
VHLDSALVGINVAFLALVSGCASLANTPSQDLALSYWTTCHAEAPGTELNTVQADGRISFWYSGAGDGQIMIECLRQAARTGPHLPEPRSELRPTGSGGAGGAM